MPTEIRELFPLLIKNLSSESTKTTDDFFIYDRSSDVGKVIQNVLSGRIMVIQTFNSILNETLNWTMDTAR